jgi:hypothetical protein
LIAMRILVCGSRHYSNRAHVYAVLDELHRATPITLLIHGACHLGGADILAEDWAKSRCVPYIGVPADKTRWPRAGPERNAKMLGYKPHRLIAFPGHAGTASMIALARRDGIPVTTASEGS